MPGPGPPQNLGVLSEIRHSFWPLNGELRGGRAGSSCSRPSSAFGSLPWGVGLLTAVAPGGLAAPTHWLSMERVSPSVRLRRKSLPSSTLKPWVREQLAVSCSARGKTGPERGGDLSRHTQQVPGVPQPESAWSQPHLPRCREPEEVRRKPDGAAAASDGQCRSGEHPRESLPRCAFSPQVASV